MWHWSLIQGISKMLPRNKKNKRKMDWVFQPKWSVGTSQRDCCCEQIKGQRQRQLKVLSRCDLYFSLDCMRKSFIRSESFNKKALQSTYLMQNSLGIWNSSTRSIVDEGINVGGTIVTPVFHWHFGTEVTSKSLHQDTQALYSASFWSPHCGLMIIIQKAGLDLNSGSSSSGSITATLFPPRWITVNIFSIF